MSKSSTPPLVLAALAGLALAGAGCGKVDCKGAINHMFDVGEKEVAEMTKDLPADQKQEQLKQLADIRATTVKQCEGKVMKKKTYDCIMKTTRMADFEKCPKFDE